MCILGFASSKLLYDKSLNLEICHIYLNRLHVFYKNNLYKNIEAEIWKKNKNKIRTVAQAEICQEHKNIQPPEIKS